MSPMQINIWFACYFRISLQVNIVCFVLCFQENFFIFVFHIDCFNYNFFFSLSLFRQAYNEKPIYTCQICEKQMKNKRSYQRHYNRHTSSQKFTCTICSKIFSQEKIFKKHESIHNLATAKECIDCKEEFFDLIKYKAHRRTHNIPNKKQQKYQCGDCGKM